MTIKLKQSTASQEIPLGYFLDSTDGNTEETALTINASDIKLWKSGATTLANKNSGGATHISNGLYYATLDATDTDTLGPLVIFVHVTGALPVRVECEVMKAQAYDTAISGDDIATIKTLADRLLTMLQAAGGSPTDYEFTEDSLRRVRNYIPTPPSVGEIQNGLATAAALAVVGGYIDTEVAAIKSVTDKLNTTLQPAGGSPGEYEFTEDSLRRVRNHVPSVAQVQSGLATSAEVAAVAAYVDTEVATIVAGVSDIQSRLPAALVSGRIDASVGAVANDAITAASLASGVGTEIAQAVWNHDISVHGAGTAGGELHEVNGVTDKLNTTLELTAGSPGEYEFTADALRNAPSGTGGGAGAPSAAEVAAAVWDTPLASHLSAGSTGLALSDVESVTDKLNTIVQPAGGSPGEYELTEDALRRVRNHVPTPPTVAQIQSGLATSGEVAAVAAYVDTEVAAIKSVTDKLNTTLALTAGSPGEYEFTADALRNAPTGSGGASGPTAAQIADAVWDEALSGHVSAGSAGLALRDTDLRGSRTVVRGTVGNATTPSTTQFTPSALSPAGADVDQFKGRIIIFDNDTATPELRGQATDITASSNAALPLLTFTALSAAPASGDTFSIV